VTDEFAEPLESDDTPELKAVRSVLKQTALENLPLAGHLSRPRTVCHSEHLYQYSLAASSSLA